MITTKLSIEKANELFKLSSKTEFALDSVEKLTGLGVQIAIGTKLAVVGPNDETIVSGIKIQPGVVQLAKEGLLGDLALGSVQAALVPALKWALDPDHWKKPTPAEDIYSWTEKGSKAPAEPENTFGLTGEVFADAGDIFDEPDDVSNAMNESLKAESESIADPSIFNEPGIADANAEDDILEQADSAPKETTIPATAMKMVKVQLLNATKMYQPVNGTSETSTYHCVGVAGAFKFAARRKGKDLSIRVEGPIETWKSKLISAGFNSDYAEKGKYTSVHFSNIDDVTAARALGAVLSGTGLEFTTPLPLLDTIEGAGK